MKSLLQIIVILYIFNTIILKDTKDTKTEHKKTPSPKDDTETLEGNNQKIELDTPYILKETGIYQIPSEKHEGFYSLKLLGIGTLKVEIYDIMDNLLQQQLIVLENDSVGYLPINLEEIENSQNGKIKIIQQTEKVLEKGTLIHLKQIQFYEIEFNQSVQIMSSFTQSIKLRVKTSKDFQIDQKNRFQFIFDSNLRQRKLAGTEELGMLINKGEVFPTKSNYKISGDTNKGWSIISTINSQSDQFCDKAECVYSILFVLRDIERFMFFSVIMTSETVLNFQQSVKFVEDLNPGEIVTYELNVPVNTKDWLFSFEPIENNPDFYIHPDTQPTKLEHYRYIGISDGLEELRVTKKEGMLRKFSMKKFFVSFKSSDPKQSSQFLFQAKLIYPNEKILIGENQFETGWITNNEIMLYYLYLKPFKGSEVYSLKFKLQSINGNSDLYLKECQLSELKECVISQEDINNSMLPVYENLYHEKIFRFSKNVPSKQNKMDQRKLDEILLNFNCMSSKNVINPFKNKFPISNSCLFVIGINSPHSNKPLNSSFYRFNTEGQNIVNEIELRKNSEIVIFRNTKMNFQTTLSQIIQEKYKDLMIKIILLTGNAEIYFSKSNQDPNENDYDQKLSLNQQNGPLLDTQIFKTDISLEDKLENNQIYYTIKADNYTMIEIYLDVTQDKETELNEKVQLDQVNQKMITQNQFYKNETEIVYYNMFEFVFGDQADLMDFLEISINTNVSGIKICVQKNKIDFDSTLGCDFESKTEILTINRKDYQFQENDSLLIQISKEVKLDQIFTRFPIMYSITLTSANKDNYLNLSRPGQVFITKLKPGSFINHRLNMYQMQETGIILLYSPSDFIQAQLFYPDKLNKPFAILSSEQFGIKIKNGKNFKQQNCTSSDCSVLVKIKNNGKNVTRVAIVFTVDQLPIQLKEGHTISIPSNQDIYLLHETAEDLPLSYSFSTNGDQLQSYSQIVSKDQLENGYIKELLNDKEFDFKTKADTNGFIFIEQSLFENFRPPIVLFLSKSLIESNSDDKQIEIISKEHMSLVTVHSKVQYLEPFMLQKTQIRKEDFAYFYLIADEQMDFSVLLSVKSGEADLYINPGLYNLTTTSHYWKKRTSYKGDELTIKTSEREHYEEAYTIGVFASEFSEITILYAPNFENMIKLNYQELVDIEILPEKTYLFDFYNSNQNFTTMLYNEFSDVEISVIRFDEEKGEDLIDLIFDEKNVEEKFLLKAGNLPRYAKRNNAKGLVGHFIIKVVALQSVARLNMLIYDEKLPIQVFSEKRFNFSQEKDSSKIFQVKLDGNYSEVDIDLNLKFGEVEFSISDDLNKFDKFEKLQNSGQKYTKFVDKKDQNIIIFKNVFVKVNALNFSEYSILIKPEEKFKRLVPYETEIIYTNQEKDIFLYFHLSKQDLLTTKNIQLDIFTIESYDNKPELLFLSSGDGIILNKKSPFIPMPVADYKNEKFGEFDHIRINVQIVEGYYVIKFVKTGQIEPVRIGFSYNYISQLEPNGAVLFADQKSVFDFRMYVSEPGVAQFLLQSCQKEEFQGIIYSSQAGNNKMVFEKDHQTQQLFFYDKIQRKNSVESFEFEIQKSNFDEPGILQFQIQQQREENAKIKVNDFYLNTQFLKSSQQMLFKDYFEEFERKNSKSFFVESNFDLINNNFVLKFKRPSFRDQLFEDYPNLSLININYKIHYSQYDNNFKQKFKICGLSLFKTENYKQIRTRQSLLVEELKKNQKGNVELKMGPDFISFAKKYKDLQVFCELEIQFIQNAETDFLIDLNYNYSTMPYFYYTIPNKEFTKQHPLLAYLLGLITTLVIIGGIVIFIIKKKKQEIVKSEDFNESDSSSDFYNMDQESKNIMSMNSMNETKEISEEINLSDQTSNDSSKDNSKDSFKLLSINKSMESNEKFSGNDKIKEEDEISINEI